MLQRTYLHAIDAEMSNLIGLAWSRNTLLTRNSQWKKYITFCHTIMASPVPADPLTVCRYLVSLSSTCEYVTINNHLSAVCVLHKFFGYPTDIRHCFAIKLVLAGIKSKYGNCPTPRMRLTLAQLHVMYAVLPSSELNYTLWTAVVFSFRTLLGKSNIVPISGSFHTLCRNDIKFTIDGAILSVGSTKTLHHNERLLVSP